ncbi:MAG: hypothetical protein LC772_12025 [Chloroflexi bacterium]|nr:hypothetical protein [Chloroflexota bacterium]
MDSPPRISFIQPAADAEITDPRPTICALFTGGDHPIDPAGIRLIVDGEDVTARSTLTPALVTYRPPAALLSGRVEVDVTTADTSGAARSRSWEFTVRGDDEAPVSPEAATSAREEIKRLRRELNRRDREVALLRRQYQSETAAMSVQLEELRERLRQQEDELAIRSREWAQEEAFLREQAEQNIRARADLSLALAAERADKAVLLARLNHHRANGLQLPGDTGARLQWHWRTGKTLPEPV